MKTPQQMLGTGKKARGAAANSRFYALFFLFASGYVFLNILFAITSCTKSVSEQSEAERMIHTFNHSAKDSKKTKQLLTEIL